MRLPYGFGFRIQPGARGRAGGGIDPDQWKLAGTGLRWAGNVATVSGNNFKVADFAIGMPDDMFYEWLWFIPTFYMTTAAEVDTTSVITVQGIAIINAGGLRTRVEVDGGFDDVVIDPATGETIHGKWIRCRSETMIGGGGTQRFTIAYHLSDGTIPQSRTVQANSSQTNIFGQAMPVERWQGGTSSFLPALSGSTVFNNTGGPRPPLPSLMMVRGLQTAYLGLGDSIQYGSAQATGTALWTNRMAFGHLEMGMDDNTSSKRIPGNNLAMPGWNMTASATAGSHANATASMRQLWAIEKALEINDGRPIADIIVCGHGQNSVNSGTSVLLAGARALASIWRTAIGNPDAPIWWSGMVPDAQSTDGFQTVANQTPRAAADIYPTGARWQFNAAMEDGGELRADGTITAHVSLWPVASADSTTNRDKFAVRPFNTTLTSTYTGTGNLFMAAAPPLGAWLTIIDGTTVYSGAQVTAVSGTGPYEVSMGIPGSPTISSGAIVQERWIDGSGTGTLGTTLQNGVHPSALAHVLYSQKWIDTKVAQGFVPATVAPVLSGVSISGLAEDGQTLTANYTFTGFPTPSIDVSWEDGAGVDIGTGNTLLQNAGAMGLVNGETITLRVNASNIAGTDEKTANTTFSAATSALVMPSPVAYFVAPANVPTGTTRMTFRCNGLKVPALSTFALLFTQESNGCDFRIETNGDVRIAVEDTAGTRVYDAVLVAGGINDNGTATHDIVFDVNHATQQVSVTINGTTTTGSFSTPGTGSFQNSREVSFLAGTAGANPLPTGTEFRDLSVDYNGTLHKAISNSAATANADAWKQGSGSFTNV